MQTLLEAMLLGSILISVTLSALCFLAFITFLVVGFRDVWCWVKGWWSCR